MEQRYKMREAYSDVTGLKKGDVNIFYLETADHFYLGVECAPEDNEALTWYFSPTGERESFVFLYCGEDTFDELVQNLNRVNSKAVEKAWPLFANALVNGCDDNYGSPALIKLGSIENVNGCFWCLAQKVENFDLSELENLAGDYAMRKVGGLLSYYGEMFRQLNENELRKLDLVVGGAKEGFRWGRIAKLAVSVGSVLLGLPFGDGGD